MQSIKKEISVYILYIILFFLTAFVYLNYLTKLYGEYPDILNIEKIPAALLMLTLAIIFIRKKDFTSKFFLHLGLSTLIMPTLVMYVISDLPTNFALLTTSAFIITAFGTNIIHVPILKTININSYKITNFLILLSIIFIVSVFSFGGARFINFDLTLVYDFREDAQHNLPGIYGYLSPIIGKVIIPFAIIFSLTLRRWPSFLIAIGCAILLFSLTSHKAPLFYPLVIVTIYFVLKSSSAINYFLIILILLTVFSTIDFLSYQDSGNFPWLFDLYFRRSIFDSPLLNWYYYDFFSDHEKYFWSESKFTLGLLENPYKVESSNLIGIYYFNNDAQFANTGWIGSGFANAGTIGVYIYSIIISLIFSILDTYAKKHSPQLIIALFTIPVLTMLRATDLPAMLLTHGLLVSLLIISITKPIKVNHKAS